MKEYILNEFGLKVSSLYIAQVKKKCGIDIGENHNLPKSEDARQPQVRNYICHYNDYMHNDSIWPYWHIKSSDYRNGEVKNIRVLKFDHLSVMTDRWFF